MSAKCLCSDALLIEFTKSIDNPAFISDSDGVVLFSNKNANLFLGYDVSGMSISDMQNLSISSVASANLAFCKYVEQLCLSEQKSLLSLELFDGKSYIVFRTNITYKLEPSLLTIICRSEGVNTLENTVCYL
ncbi:MAG: hypothetical protein ACRCTB_06330 [Vibrio sp.]